MRRDNVSGLSISYTTFDLSRFSVEESHIVSDDTVQKTNERFEGDADLYDYLVSLSLSGRWFELNDSTLRALM